MSKFSDIWNLSDCSPHLLLWQRSVSVVTVAVWVPLKNMQEGSGCRWGVCWFFVVCISEWLVGWTRFGTAVSQDDRCSCACQHGVWPPWSSPKLKGLKIIHLRFKNQSPWFSPFCFCHPLSRAQSMMYHYQIICGLPTKSPSCLICAWWNLLL